MNNIFFKTLFKKGAKGAKGERGTSYEVPTNGIIGFDDEDGELDIPEGYDDATIPPYLVDKTIRANGVYDPRNEGAFGYSNVTVNTGDAPVLVSKTITENGTYNPADDNADGYSSIRANVSAGIAINWKLENKKVAATGGVYITTNLDEELDDNSWYIISFSDPSYAGSNRGYDKTTFMYYYTSGTINHMFYGRGNIDIATLTLTKTTVSLSSYAGDYRDIYCKISKIDTTDRIYI